MAGSSVIGALRVDLGLNSAQFNTGLAKAQTGLKGFGKAATVGFAAVAVAATAAATAIGMGVKHALDHADALGKSAQKAGVAVEALSRLEYAGKLADVSLESLTGGLQKLSKSMVEVAGGKGPAAAFQALGIAVKDGLGNLRSGDQVFADVADRFSRMEDSALKTSLAMQIFGKSGAELIPLLNEGRDGLAALAAESDRLGITIGAGTAKAAEKFNDTLTKIQGSLNGVFNKIIGDEGVQTAIQSLADTLASPEFAASMTQFASIVIKAIDTIAWAAIQAKKVIDALTPGNGMTVRMPGESDADFMTRLGRNPDGSRKSLPSGNLMPTGPVLNDLISGSFNNLSGAGTFDSVSSLWASMGGKGGSGLGGGGGEDIFTPLTTGAAAAADALEPLDLGLQEVEDKVTSLAETISSTLADSLTNIAETLLTGGDAAAAFANEMKNLGLQLLRSGLNSLFGNMLNPVAGAFGGGGYVPGFGSYGTFAEGGISNVPAIFGESGPEAAVPLPDGRRIPVELRGAGGMVNNYYIDAKGAELGVEEKIVRAIDARVPSMIDSRAPSAVAKSNMNNRRG